MPDPRYPIGPLLLPEHTSPDDCLGWIEEIEALPANLRAALAGVTEAELNTPYRDRGWTIRETVHHIADSHINAVVRFEACTHRRGANYQDLQRSLMGQTCRHEATNRRVGTTSRRPSPTLGRLSALAQRSPDAAHLSSS